MASNTTPEVLEFDPVECEHKMEVMKSSGAGEDVRPLGARKQLAEILNSQVFREELEDYAEFQLRSGPRSGCLVALKQMLSTSSSPLLPSTPAVASGPIIPISDIRGVNSSTYSKGEKSLRCKLASVYRLMDIRGWTSGIRNHITSRMLEEPEHILINPVGLLYKEVTAGNLVKIDMHGRIIDRGNTVLGINRFESLLHAAVYTSRPDVNCVIHVRTPSVVCVSAMKRGLLPLSQDSLMVGNIDYIEFDALHINEHSKDNVLKNISHNSQVIIIRNHGALVCGSTIEEAWRCAAMLVAGCNSQTRMAPTGLDNLTYASEEAIRIVATNLHSNAVNLDSKMRWEPGALEFEAEMRKLDNMGYRTGYIYKAPIM